MFIDKEEEEKKAKELEKNAVAITWDLLLLRISDLSVNHLENEN